MTTEFPRRLRRTAGRGWIGLLLVLFLFPASLAAQGFASLEEQMTGDEFEAAGLEKLTPQELATLNAWIRTRSLATLDAPRSSSPGAVAEGGSSDPSSRNDIEEMPREPIVSRINGRFSGWDGQTVFKLENGMIWAQADNDKFYTQEMQSPTVTIEPALFGSWKLSVEGHDEDCRVKRVQ